MSQDTYQLYSFENDRLEQQRTQQTPGKSRCYFIVALENGRCELLLSSIKQQFLFFPEAEINTLLNHQKIHYQAWLGEWDDVVYGVALVDKWVNPWTRI